MNMSENVLNKELIPEPQTTWYQSITVGIIAMLLCVSAAPTFAQYKYIGVWDSGSGTNLITEPLRWNAFLKKGEELTEKGLRLDDFEVIRKGTKKRYIGSWRNGSGNNIISRGLKWKAFLKKGEELTQKGYRLWDFETFRQSGKRVYVGNWRTGTGNNIITEGLKWKDFTKKGEELTAKGYRLWDFEIYKKGNTYRYVGNWRTGSGSNIINKALRMRAFIRKNNELKGKGLRLYDVEIIKTGGVRKYVGAWRSGSGSNAPTGGNTLAGRNAPTGGNTLAGRNAPTGGNTLAGRNVPTGGNILAGGNTIAGNSAITKGLAWKDFVSKGEELTAQGLRLTDFEPFFVAEPTQPNSTSGGDSGISGISEFPDTPQYIKLLSGTLGNDKYRVVVDFTSIIDSQPTITIPTQFLKDLPSYEGEVIFPNNFCGMRIIKASRFVWSDGFGNVFDDSPYNTVPENTTIKDLFSQGETLYLGGIDFTGPVGACANGTGNWQFPFPYTQTQTVMPQPLKLVIELGSDSEIEFLNFNINPGKSLSSSKLFKKIDFDKMIKFYLETFYGSFESWIDRVCEQNPDECPLQKED